MSKAPCGHPDRRDVLAGAAAAGFLALAGTSAKAAGTARVRPGQPGWPGKEDWSGLQQSLGDRLQPVALPPLNPANAPALLSNPFYLRDHAGLTQSSGRIDGWRSAPSAFAVRARDASDVSTAIRFATRHRMRLVVKGAGHSYLGGSSAPDSLLVWTRDLETITLHDAFVPAGTKAPAVPAVSVGAGCIWHDVYDAVTTKGGRYVQGGGCTTVGVAGLVQGGGFGSYSKNYGLAAASLLEAEIVTADGKIRTVNVSQEPDLFWALKGGGGGTFGVVTRLTLRAHDLPENFGFLHWKLHAKSDDAFRQLLRRFVALYADHLLNPHWGETVRARADNRFEATMLFQGLDQPTALAAWSDLTRFVAAHAADYDIEAPLIVAPFPAARMWDESFLHDHLPSAIATDDRANARPGDWWWAGNTNEAGAFWHGYESAWIPASLLAPTERNRLADAWFDASRHWSVAFHFNKGLAGAPASAIAASRDTAMNPQVLDAFALAIIAMDGASAFPGLPAPDLADARGHLTQIHDAMAALRRVAPGAGSYLSECDFDLPGWQQACWGEHWPRLDAIKTRIDPDGLFVVHHGIGSQHWSRDGFTRIA